ncbi:MAG: recombinase family protein, partial [Muribaculaceae bacterium]|nr:recombinase family protein [Muribaculaceae bacterium]
QDNVDTANRDSGAMEMMPIMNVFNEWHAANTSKKIRAVKRSHALEGKFSGSRTPYGYLKGTDEKRTFIVDEETAPNVVRIFEMYASGISPQRIAEIFNAEDIPSAGRIAFLRTGRKYNNNEHPYWEQATIRPILKNIAYLGHLAQQKFSCVSYKNHKVIQKDMSDWVIIYNTHEPIISQELWDRVHERMKSQANGRKMHTGVTHPLSGFVYCADCGGKLKMGYVWNKKTNDYKYNFDCGRLKRYGKSYCFSHYIQANVLEEIVLEDIRATAKYITLDEQAVKDEFVKHNAEMTDNTVKSARKELKAKQRRLEELSRLMQIAYEDRMKGKMPEDICVEFIEKYSAEKKTVTDEITALEEKIAKVDVATQNVDDFIRNIKKYLEVPKLTREMCYELIDRIVVGGLPKVTGKERSVDIVYKADMSSVLKYRTMKRKTE